MSQQEKSVSPYYYPVLLGIVALGAAALFAFHPVFTPGDIWPVVIFLVMTMVAEANPVILSNGQASVSVGFALVFAGLIIFGPGAGVWLAAFGTMTLEQFQGKVRWEIVLYNRAQLALSAAAGGMLFTLFGGTPGALNPATDFVALIACASAYFVVNLVQVLIAVSLLHGVSINEAWLTHRKALVSASYLVLVPLAILIAMIYLAVGPAGVVLFILPLIVARFALQRYVDTEKFLVGTINALVRAIEARDEYTSGHSERVKNYAVATATEIGLSADQLKMLEYLASLHDIGKIGIRDGILRKDGPLTAEEYEEVKQHPVMGATILGQLETLGRNVDMLKYHHERYDGKGYPTGLTGTSIPLGARIIAVCDSYDAMTSHRPYRPVKTPQEAVLELQKCSGTQFDPDVVRAFCRVIGQLDLPVKGDSDQ